MSSFLRFIEDDIDAKKTLISTMPTNNKRNQKKYYEKIEDILSKYVDYKDSVYKYITIKSKSFALKEENENEQVLRSRVKDLEHLRFILNPSNTYIEKMGFDNLLYQIRHYYDFNFKSLNVILNGFLDKFEVAGILLTSDDFDYTVYVNEYMDSYLEVRKNKSENYEKVSLKFEEIYWLNPDIIQHIELNFRKLIRKYQKKFEDYINRYQNSVLLENKINGYEDCLEQLSEAYSNLERVSDENIVDIIDMAKSGTIDINTYFEDSKIRVSTYRSLVIEPIDFKDNKILDKFVNNIKKLKNNLEEYSNYIKFYPLILDFKKQYEQDINKEINPKDRKNFIKEIEGKIVSLESKLEKTNKQILGMGGILSKFNSASPSKKLKTDSVKQAKELYELYKQYDEEYFKDKVYDILSNSLNVSELLHLFYSFDFFKKQYIKRVFDINTYEEIQKYSESFDLFEMNPNNIIITGTYIFEENHIAKIIMNRYRLDNINLTEEGLSEDNLPSLIEKVDFVLRSYEIDNSKTSVEKIWFMVQTEKIKKIETKAS